MLKLECNRLRGLGLAPAANLSSGQAVSTIVWPRLSTPGTIPILPVEQGAARDLPMGDMAGNLIECAGTLAAVLRNSTGQHAHLPRL